MILPWWLFLIAGLVAVVVLCRKTIGRLIRRKPKSK